MEQTIKRYMPALKNNNMINIDNGDYVKYSDYEALLKENSELKESKSHLKERCEGYVSQYQQEVSDHNATIELLDRANEENKAMTDDLDKCKTALDKIYNHNEAARAAVVQHFGVLHLPTYKDKT